MAAASQPVQERYSRQVLFSGIGPEGQARIERAHVAVVGVGATGAAAASLLARAGVGTLTLIDRDFVEESNLQRQVLFDEADARDSRPRRTRRNAKSPPSTARSRFAPISQTSFPATSMSCCREPASFSTLPTTSKPATCSTTTPSNKAKPGFTPPRSAPTPRP